MLLSLKPNLNRPPMKTLLLALIVLPVSLFAQNSNLPNTNWDSLLEAHAAQTNTTDWDSLIKAEAQQSGIPKRANVYELTHSFSASDNSRDKLHAGAANVFCDKVGDHLKQNYPSRVDHVELDIVSNGSQVTLTYIASISGCDPRDADWYFDHRGALTSWLTQKADAEKDSEKRCSAQIEPARKSFREKLGEPKVYYISGYGTWHKGKYYSLTEAFFAAKKK